MFSGRCEVDKGNMVWKLIFGFCVLSSATASSFDFADQKVYKQEHCIRMTPEKHNEIQAVVNKISDFINRIAEEHESLDIRHVRFDIEAHTDDEEKEIILKVNINDCANIEEELKEEAAEEEEIRNEQGEEDDSTEENSNENADEDEQVIDSKEVTSNVSNSDSEKKSEEGSNVTNDTKEKRGCKHCNGKDKQVIPEVRYLELSENGEKYLKEMEKIRGKKPVVLIIHESNGQIMQVV